MVDTNIFCRMALPNHPQNAVAVEAVWKLRFDGAALVVCPQVLYEIWAVATRPLSANGLGMTDERAFEELDFIEKEFHVIEGESPMVKIVWRDFIRRHTARGKQAHDAHLAATLFTNRIDKLLTFNADDFRRYTEITVRTPAEALEKGFAGD
jgi:predicted nucleic acid-binding protein